MPVSVSVFKRLPDYAYEDDEPPETDSGGNGVGGGRTEPVCLCGILHQ